jgi:tight adherence protein C
VVVAELAPEGGGVSAALPWLWAVAVLVAARGWRPVARRWSSRRLQGVPTPLRAWRTRAESRRHERAVVDELPDVVDLLVLAVGAGANVRLAIEAVAPRAPPAFGAALDAALGRARGGARLADALVAATVPLGEPTRALVASIVAADRYGVPLLPALERLAADGRADRRRRADEAARRLPVTLLFPLVLCVLPAFGLLTIAPLVAGAFRSLGR